MGKYSHLSYQEKLDLLKSRQQALKRLKERLEKSRPKYQQKMKRELDLLAQDRKLKREQESSTEQGVCPV